MSHEDDSENDILGLSEIPPTPAESEKPEKNHPMLISKRVGTFLLSAGFTFVVGLVVGAFQVAGVTSMALAHMLMALAWVIAVFAVWLWLLSRPRKHTLMPVLLTACIFALAFFLGDRGMVWKKAEQERAAARQSPQSLMPSPLPSAMPSSPTMSPTPVKTQKELADAEEQKAFSLNGHIEKVIIDGQSEAKGTLAFVLLSVGNVGDRPSAAINYKLRIETNSLQYSGDAQEIDKEYSLTNQTEKTTIHPEESLIKKTNSPIPVPQNG